VTTGSKDFCTGYSQKNGAVSKVNKKFISYLSRAQLTPSATATVQVSCALPVVGFSCLLLVVHEKLGQLLLLTVYVVTV
jgi:hypothetical protein